ncbi:MAG: hypothetical protein J4203_04410 [Candidatus Diapherotrites archaeon]|uniref:histidine kinase n=2 Tax=Candidatus Iainarchaeum sp. TaxID=3101447 RepID=A0A8T4L855_9ARCH|nr:hypothetical protein [Candidatus Diapherotrites archaeon]
MGKTGKPGKTAKAKGLHARPATGLHARLKALEAELARLRQADKLRDEFLDVVSHELKTPLVPIMGYIDIWADETLDPEIKQKSLEIVRRNARRLKNLIDDILLVSKLESGKLEFEFQAADLREVAGKAFEGAKALAEGKKIQLGLEAPADLPQAEVDAPLTGKVLENLVQNAVKFTPENGRVTVKISAGKGKALVQVVDTGIGIEARHLPHLFQKFYQVDSSATRQFGGTGLGLDICKRIVERHNGKIWVESKPGAGSTFSFEVPVKHTGSRK